VLVPLAVVTAVMALTIADLMQARAVELPWGVRDRDISEIEVGVE
jgi:hypothetical protein